MIRSNRKNVMNDLTTKKCQTGHPRLLTTDQTDALKKKLSTGWKIKDGKALTNDLTSPILKPRWFSPIRWDKLPSRKVTIRMCFFPMGRSG
jgi:hypothetical protein